MTQEIRPALTITISLHNEAQEEFKAVVQLDAETLLKATSIIPLSVGITELEQIKWQANINTRNKAQGQLSQQVGLAFGTLLGVLTNKFHPETLH